MAKYILRPPQGDKMTTEEFAYMLCDIIAGRGLHPRPKVHERPLVFAVTGSNNYILQATGDEAGVFSLSCLSPLSAGLQAYLAERFNLEREWDSSKPEDLIQATIEDMKARSRAPKP